MSALRDDDKEGVPKGLRDLLSLKLKEQGWETIRHFQRGARVPYSIETVRRAFSDCDYKNLAPITLAVIMKCLGYQPPAIKSILKEYIGDHAEIELIGDKESPYTVQEESLVKSYRVLCQGNEDMSRNLADNIDMLARLANVNTKKFTDILRKGCIYNGSV